MSDGREAVLARVRAALGPAPEIPEVPRDYRQAGALGAGGDPDDGRALLRARRGLPRDREASERGRAGERAGGRL